MCEFLNLIYLELYTMVDSCNIDITWHIFFILYQHKFLFKVSHSLTYMYVLNTPCVVNNVQVNKQENIMLSYIETRPSN